MNTKSIILSAISLLILGCNKMETTDAPSEGAMSFTVDYPATKATETAFEAGDRIGVYITAYENGKPLELQLGGNFKNNNPVVFDGTKWTADPVIYWNDKIEKYNVFAYYPFCEPSSVDEMPFSVKLDQGIEETTERLSSYEASDFLYASQKGVTEADGNVNLLFKHKMSKLTVNLLKGEDFEGEIPAEMTIYIHNTVTDCLIDLSTGDVIKDPYAPAKTITTKRIDEDTYTAIVVPQMITNQKPMLEIIFKDVSYMIERKFQFKTGMHHVLNVTLNNNADKVKVEIGGEIEGWN